MGLFALVLGRLLGFPYVVMQQEIYALLSGVMVPFAIFGGDGGCKPLNRSGAIMMKVGG